MTSALTLTKQHRAEMRTLTGLADNDLSLIWATFNHADAAAVRDGLIEVLPRLVDMYGSAAATLGADWYDEMRAAAKVTGKFSAIAAELPDVERTDVLARWAVGPLFGAAPDSAAALSLVSGGLQRIIADADRQSVMGSLRADSRGVGWQRVTSGGCDFCVMLAGRGDVYSADTADFSSHDHCRCAAVPSFDQSATVHESTDWRPLDSTPSNTSGLSAFDSMSRAQVLSQIKTLEGLKDSAYRTKQLARLQARLEQLT